MKIRKVTVNYSKKGIETSATVEYKGTSTARTYEGTFPMTVAEFIFTARECKTYHTTAGSKFDVYTA
jgi:hypothetical protein